MQLETCDVQATAGGVQKEPEIIGGNRKATQGKCQIQGDRLQATGCRRQATGDRRQATRPKPIKPIPGAQAIPFHAF
jgi:hypothetical protein